MTLLPVVRIGPLGSARPLENSLRFYSKLPFIPLTMNVAGKALRLRLDTGACGLVLFEEAIKGQIVVRHTNRFEHRGHVGGQTRRETILLREVSLRESHWKEVSGYLIGNQKSDNGNTAGNLGWTSLGLKVLQIDLETGQLSWER